MENIFYYGVKILLFLMLICFIAIFLSWEFVIALGVFFILFFFVVILQGFKDQKIREREAKKSQEMMDKEKEME